MKTDTELLAKALKIIEHKTVGADWRNQVIEEIYNAVERAENPPVGFEEWWEATGKRCWPYEHEALKYTWGAAQQAERERIRDIIKAVGVQGNHNEWFDCVDTILERIDDSERR